MPQHEVQTAFNAGELTDKVAARVDTQKYRFGAECLKNWVCVPQGGISSRAGTIFIAEAKYRDKLFVLHKFEPAVDQPYMLEIGEGYIRFYTDRARLEVDDVPVEVETPYTEDELRELRFDQSVDVMYVTHRNHQPMKLERLSATEFEFVAFNASPPPTFEQEVEFAATLTLSALTGTSVTATTDASVFLDGDKGRTIIAGSGLASIQAVVSGTQVTLDITSDFTTTVFASGDWRMGGSPNAGTISRNGGGPTSGTNALPDFATPGAVFGVTTSLAAFRSTDVGKHLVFDGGIGEIIVVASTTIAAVKLEKVFTQNVGAAGAWTLESNAWSDDLGWPGVVRFSQQRLWFAGSNHFPDSVWGSVTGDYQNFGVGAADDDALNFAIAESGLNLIRWMQPIPEGLALGTLAGEITIEGSNDSSITVTSLRIRPRTDWGSDHDVDSIRVDKATLYLQRGAIRLREFAFAFDDNNYTGVDLNALSEHITKPGVVAMAYARTPESFVFCVREDGVLLSLTYERAQDVVGWSHHETAGDFETVAVMPNFCGTADEVWVGIKRTGFSQGSWWHQNWWHANWWHEDWWAEGANTPRGLWFTDGWFAQGWFYDNGGWFGSIDETTSRRAIEIFDGAMTLDSALTYEGDPSDTFDGIEHLEGMSIKAIADDNNVYTVVVADGSITLPVQTRTLVAGLPFNCIAKTLRPELQTPLGTAQGRRKRWNSVQLRVYCTEGTLKVNDEALQLPEDSRVPFTGDLRPQTAQGWTSHGQHTIVLDEPKKATILDFKGSLQVDDGGR